MTLGAREIPNTATPEARAWAERAFELRDGDEGQREAFEVSCCGQTITWHGSQATCPTCGWEVSTANLIKVHGLESLGRTPAGSVERISI